MALDHVAVPVSDYARAVEFYKAALAPLGLSLLMEVPGEYTQSQSPAAGFGREVRSFFWLGVDKAVTGRVHVAFAARSRDEVDAFYKAALAAGGRDNGAPGLRPHYHADYYGAFVLDPDGHNIEAVHRGG